MSTTLEVYFGGDVTSATAIPTATVIVETGVKGDPGVQGPPGQPASLGGSLRSVSSKAEAGGPWTVIAYDEILDLSVSNRFIGMIVDERWNFSYAVPANAPAGTTLAIKFVSDNGSFDWAGVTWPDPGTPPTIVNNPNKVTSLAFEKLPNGQWLGFVGPVHAWNGV